MYIIIGADSREYGPITAEQLRQWIIEGRANAQTRVRAEGLGDWKLLGDLPEFTALFAAQPSPATPVAFSATPTPRTNTLAITGLVLGILSVTVGCCCYGLPFNIAGIVCSSIALSQINKDPLNQQGKNMAIAGLVLSILSILLFGMLLIFGVAANWTDMLRKVQRL